MKHRSVLWRQVFFREYYRSGHIHLSQGNNALQHRQFFLFAETSAECFLFFLRATASRPSSVSTASLQCKHFSRCSSASPVLLLKDTATWCLWYLADTGDNFTLTNLWLWEKSTHSNVSFRQRHCCSVSLGSPVAFAMCAHNVFTVGKERGRKEGGTSTLRKQRIAFTGIYEPTTS